MGLRHAVTSVIKESAGDQTSRHPRQNAIRDEDRTYEQRERQE